MCMWPIKFDLILVHPVYSSILVYFIPLVLLFVFSNSASLGRAVSVSRWGLFLLYLAHVTYNLIMIWLRKQCHSIVKSTSTFGCSTAVEFARAEVTGYGWSGGMSDCVCTPIRVPNCPFSVDVEYPFSLDFCFNFCFPFIVYSSLHAHYNPSSGNSDRLDF